MIPAGSSSAFSARERRHALLADLPRQPRRVVAPDRVMVGDRAAARRRSPRSRRRLTARHCSISSPSRWRAMNVKYSDAPVSYRCETWHITSPGVPCACERALDRARSPRRAARSHVRPPRGGLQRLDHHAVGEQLVAQVRRREARPAATPRPASAPTASAAVAARQRERARAPCARPPARSPSKPRIARQPLRRLAVAAQRRDRRARAVPSGRPRRPAPATCASPRSSDSRATSGGACSWASARSACTPGGEALEEHALVDALAPARARTRSESSSITPSVPSEPTSSSRSPGPAALAGIAAQRRCPRPAPPAAGRAPSCSMRP